ncbi:MAG: DUF1444 family protein, partial [Planctomycetes bacterium]|nr:DUF1444 family protein [Planctomycetota bacterium]
IVEPETSPEQFALRVLDLARQKFPLVSSELVEDFHLQLGESRVNLYSLYRSYLDAPEHFERITLRILSTAVRIQERGEDQLAPPWEEVRSRLFPMLYPQPESEQWLSYVVGEPWVADLRILFVVDEGDTYWYVREDLRERWGFSVDQLKQFALANLETYFEEKQDELVVTDLSEGPAMVMPREPDAYNATRVLSESFQRLLLRLLGHPCLIGVPNRDFFVAFRADEELRERIHQKVAEDHRRMDHPLTDRLLLLGPDGVSEFFGFSP